MIFGCAALLLGSAAIFHAEISPQLGALSDIPELHATLRSGAAQPGPSLNSKTEFLRACAEVAQSPISLVQPRALRQEFENACSDLVDGILEEMPSNARAWLVGAMIASLKGDALQFNDMLRGARRTAPYVQWVATARIDLAERNLALLDAAGVAAEADDFRVLLDSGEGVQTLAATYALRPGTRDRIMALIESAPATTQERFLSIVRQRYVQ